MGQALNLANSVVVSGAENKTIVKLKFSEGWGGAQIMGGDGHTTCK